MKVFSLLVIFFTPQVYSSYHLHYERSERENCIVTLTTGRILGNCSNPLYDAFTNIPYARPPIGALRFEAPRPMNKWKDVRDASGTPVACVHFFNMFPQLTGREDCLNVHVYIPRVKRKSCERLKVLIWIHYGAYQVGNPAIDPKLIMSAGNSIVVTLTHRFGPLGFYSTATKSMPGNNGLKDQRMAIQWIEDNISVFGGDPTKIVLIGNSAGAASTQFHRITGTSSKIRAYVELSGSVLSPWAFTKKPKIPAKELAKKLRCSFDLRGDCLKNCLKQRSLSHIWRHTLEMQKFYDFSIALFRPTIEPESAEDAFLTRDPIYLLREGNYKKRPVLIGTTEGMGAFSAGILTRFVNETNTEAMEELNSRWYKVCPIIFFLNEDRTKKQQRQICKYLKHRYMRNKCFGLGTYKLLERMFADEFFVNSIEKSVNLQEGTGHKVYRYLGDLPLRFSLAHLSSLGRLDLCYGSALDNDALGLFPTQGLLLAPLTKKQKLTYYALLSLIESLLSKRPRYKNLYLPANSDNSCSDRCLRFSFDKQIIGSCDLRKINYHHLGSIECRHKPKMEESYNHS